MINHLIGKKQVFYKEWILGNDIKD